MHRHDLGVGGDLSFLGDGWSALGYAFKIENLLDHRYNRHLSDTRDPFSSGFRVLEPGRTIRVQLRYRY